MNPQFQNTMGMGRGMPMGNMQQMNTQNTSLQLQKYILQTLQGEGPWTGWQAQVPLQERVMQIKQLVDSLRLLGPPVELSRAVEVALNFERKEFAAQPTKEDYQRECADKLSKIRDQRQVQSRAQQMNGGPNNAMMNPNFQQQMQMRQNMMMQPQMQAGMQASPMATPNQAMAQMQNMNQGQPMNQMAQMAQMNQMNPMSQMNQMAQQPNNPMQQMGNQSTGGLTKEENDMINQRAAELAKGTQKDEMRNIVQRMDLRLRNNLAQKGIDPIIYHFRMLATKEFRQRQMQGGSINQAQMNNNANPSMAMMNQMSNGQQGNAEGAMMKNGARPNGTPFMTDYSQFKGAQEEGWKSQQEGQTVVPASNNQNLPPNQMQLQQQLMNGQRLNQPNPQMNQNLLAQQQLRAAQLNQQQQQQQQRQMQVAQAQAQAQNQARAQLAANQANMNMLNRSVGSGIQNGSPQPQRPPSRTPMQGQQPQMGNQMGPSQLQQQMLQNPQAFMARLPPNLQQFLKTKPPNEWMPIIQRFQQSQVAQQNMRRSMSQQTAQQAGQQQGQQPGQPMANNQMLGPGPSAMQQSLSAGPAGNVPTPEVRNAMPNTSQQQQPQQPPQNASMTPNPELVRGRQLQLQQQQRMAAGQATPQPPSASQPTPLTSDQPQRVPGQQAPSNGADLPKRPLNQQEMNVMDMQPVLPQVLRNVQQLFAAQNTFVPEFKNWSQFKQWLMQNPQQKLTMPMLLSMQANQFQYQVRMKQQNAAAQMAGGPQMQQPHQQQALSQQQQQPQVQQPQQQTPQQQQQPQQPQNAQQNMSQMQGMTGGPPQLRPITDQEIQKFRQTNLKAQGMSDDQIRVFLNRMRLQAIAQQQQKNQMQQPFMQQPNQNQNMGQMASQQASAPAQTTSAQTQPQQNQMQGLNNLNRSQPPKPQGQQQSQPQQPPASQQKNLKRPNQDEASDAQHLNQGAARPQQGEQAKPSMPQQLTKEQFEKLSDNDKLKYMQAMKLRQRQELQRRINEFSKQVQSQTPQLRPITSMDPASRKRITNYLTSDATKNMLNRFEPFLLAYCHIENNEPTIKQLLSNRNHLVAQYKPTTVADKTWEPADNFSISAENVESIINNMSAKFQQTMAKQTQRQNQQNQQQQQQNHQGQTQQQPQQQQLSQQSQQQLPLTAENLNLAQAQALQQSKKSQKSKDIPPAAPTASQPPFQIGENRGDRGHGAPRYPATQSLKQEDLKLDPAKRRKKNPGAATPTTAIASPDITQEAKPIPRPFKCSHNGCEYQSTGFVNREELDQHMRTMHKPEMEIVTDPLAFLDNSLMQAFDLDEQFHTKRRQEPMMPSALPMQKTLSKAGSHLKMESKPSTPIPMGRNLSQQTGKLNAPTTPNMLRTPQSLKAEIKGATPKPAEMKEEPDLWLNSNFSLDTLRDTFGDMEWSDVMPTMDPEQVDLDECIKTYMQSDDWQKVMNGGVLPTSSDGSTDKSKSPGDGSERSATAADAQKQNEPAKQSTDIDLSIDGINIDQDGFEDLIMTESQMQELEEGSWEKIEKPSPDGKVNFNMSDPFASLDDPDLDAWSKPLYEPLQANGFPDSNSPFEAIDLDEFVAMNGPEVWAAGSMEWNAVGETGQQIRRDLGWPIEGAQGIQK